MKQRSAFTLLELLMVSAILALLIGMLVPSLYTAVEFPRRANCLNNLRKIGVALYSYQGANNGCLPAFSNSTTPAPTGNTYDWIWPDSLAPYISGKPAGPGVESSGPAVATVTTRTNYPGKSIWACPDAQLDPNLTANYATQYPKRGFRTNYANTCGNLNADPWTPAPNKAGLVMTDGGHQSGAFDSYRICNRYNLMDSRSVLLYCGCYGCGADSGFPSPASVPNDWNLNSAGTRNPGDGVIIIPFAHLKQNPALLVNSSVKSYGKGTQMGGDPTPPVGNDPNVTSDRNTWVPIGN